MAHGTQSPGWPFNLQRSLKPHSFKDLKVLKRVRMCLPVYTHMCSAHGGQKRVSDTPGTGVVVNCPMWVLGMELGSPVGVASALTS